MKLRINNHKHENPHPKQQANQFHGLYSRIFKIINRDSLGFVEANFEDGFEIIPGTTTGKGSSKKSDWILTIGGDSIDSHVWEEIISLKNVEEI